MSEKHEIQVRFLSLAQRRTVKLKRLLTHRHFDHATNEVNEKLQGVIAEEGEFAECALHTLSGFTIGIILVVERIDWHVVIIT